MISDSLIVLTKSKERQSIKDTLSPKKNKQGYSSFFPELAMQYIRPVAQLSESFIDNIIDLNRYVHDKTSAALRLTNVFMKVILRSEQIFDDANNYDSGTTKENNLKDNQNRSVAYPTVDSDDRVSELISLIEQDAFSFLYSIIKKGMSSIPSPFQKSLIHVLVAILKKEYIEGHFADLIDKTLNQHPDLEPEFHDFLMMCLGEEDPARSDQPLAISLLRHMNQFHIQEDRLLYEKLLNYLSTYQKNHNLSIPDHVFYRVIKSVNDVLLLDAAAKASSCEKEWLSLEGIKGLFSVDKISVQELMSRAGMFPMGTALLDKVLSRFDTFISVLSSSEQKNIKDHILSCCELNMNDLRSNFSDRFFFSLLQSPSKQNISKENAYFSSLLYFLLEIQDSYEFVENFCKLSASIQNCNIGKIEGIYSCYHQLPASSKIQSLYRSEHTPAMQYVQERVRYAIEKRFNYVVASPSGMLSDLTEGDFPIDQIAHSTIYLKNILSGFIGLPYKKYYDSKAHLIPNTLRNKSVRDITDAFFKYFTLDVLISDMKEMYLQDALLSSESNNKIYYGINQILEFVSAPTEDAWQLCDDQLVVSQLTSYGANVILKYFNIIK